MKLNDGVKDNSFFSIDIDDDLPELYLKLKKSSPVQEKIEIEINESDIVNTEERIRAIFFRDKIQSEKELFPNANAEKRSHVILSYYSLKKVEETISEIISRKNKNSTLADDKKGDNTFQIPIESEYMLKSMLMSEISESGIVNTSERYFDSLLNLNKVSALHCALKIFMDCIDASKGKQINMLVNILHMLSHFNYNRVYPEGQAMAMLGVKHRDPEVCDYAIKCFENWNHPDGMKKLKAIRFNPDWSQGRSDWLIEYADDIIAEFNELKEVQ